MSKPGRPKREGTPVTMHTPTANYPRFHVAFLAKAFADINLLFARNP
jgi:hypothetical protein